MYHVLYKLEDGTFFDMSETDFAMMYANYDYRVCTVTGRTPTALLTLEKKYSHEQAAKDPVGMIGNKVTVREPQDMVLAEINFWELGPDIGMARESGFVNEVWVVGAAIRSEEMRTNVVGEEMVKQLAVPPQLGVGAKQVGVGCMP